MFSTDRKFLDVGLITAEFDNDFKFSSFDGGVNLFYNADGIKLVYVIATQKLSETTSNDIRMAFSPDIKVQRYDLPNPMFRSLPTLVEKWIDNGETYEKSYVTLPDVGHIEVTEFDKIAGTFKATFVVKIDEAGKLHEATGKITITKWTEVK